MDSPRTILIIEDDNSIRASLKMALEGIGHRVLEADSDKVGMHLFATRKPDLIVLDINLPDGSGIEICKKIRSSKAAPATPVIMLTGNSDMETKSEGFTAGADQYLTKPIHAKEFLLWVDALFKRQKFYAQEGSAVEAGELSINPDSRLVRYRGNLITNLTAREFDLLYILVKKKPVIVSRQAILSQAWKTVAVDNLVDAHLNHLRKKLPPDLADKLQSVPGKGFRFLG